MKFELIADHVALDFVNTVDNRYDPDRRAELLNSYGDLLDFCEQTAVLSSPERQKLNRIGKAAAERALRSAIELREGLEKVFSAVTEDRTTPAVDLDRLNGFLRAALPHRVLVPVRERLNWRWTGLESEPEGPLWPLAYAAAELLVSPEAAFVRECAAETCRWLFLDLSKNHSRRWCDMKLCGNRSKAKRYYQKRS